MNTTIQLIDTKLDVDGLNFINNLHIDTMLNALPQKYLFEPIKYRMTDITMSTKHKCMHMGCVKFATYIQTDNKKICWYHAYVNE